MPQDDLITYLLIILIGTFTVGVLTPSLLPPLAHWFPQALATLLFFPILVAAAYACDILPGRIAHRRKRKKVAVPTFIIDVKHPDGSALTDEELAALVLKLRATHYKELTGGPLLCTPESHRACPRSLMEEECTLTRPTRRSYTLASPSVFDHLHFPALTRNPPAPPLDEEAAAAIVAEMSEAQPRTLADYRRSMFSTSMAAQKSRGTRRPACVGTPAIAAL